jgi:3-deoxy-7-phosphoheptulonate synthase
MKQVLEQIAGHDSYVAEAILDELPEPSPENRQVEYADRRKLVDAMVEGLRTDGVTTPELARAFTAKVGRVVTEKRGMVVLSGDCNERIQRLDTPMSRLVNRAVSDLNTVNESDLQNAQAVLRLMGQYVKPRTEDEEMFDGKQVLTYRGDLIHGEDPADREPNPDNIVAGIDQARDLRKALNNEVGYHVPVMHEFLSMHYEMPQIREDRGELFSVAADAHWGGVRTNDPDNDIMQLLKLLGNTTGVKLDGTTTEEQIVALEELLNPDGIAGKSMYMLRVEEPHFDRLPIIAKNLHDHAPNALVGFDIHGSTEKLPGGRKVRHVGTMLRNMNVTAKALIEAGVFFGLLSLETIPDQDRLECIDEYDQTPEPGGIDPGLNPLQFLPVLNRAAELQAYQASILRKTMPQPRALRSTGLHR